MLAMLGKDKYQPTRHLHPRTSFRSSARGLGRSGSMVPVVGGLAEAAMGPALPPVPLFSRQLRDAVGGGVADP